MANKPRNAELMQKGFSIGVKGGFNFEVIKNGKTTLPKPQDTHTVQSEGTFYTTRAKNISNPQGGRKTSLGCCWRTWDANPAGDPHQGRREGWRGYNDAKERLLNLCPTKIKPRPFVPSECHHRRQRHAKGTPTRPPPTLKELNIPPDKYLPE